MEHMDRSALLVLHHYNDHANLQVLTTAAELDEDAFIAQSSPSHGSVQQLLMHMLAVEASFLSKCQEQPLELLKMFQVESLSLAEIKAGFSQVSDHRQEYLMAISDEKIAEEVAFLIAGHPFKLARWQLITQSLVHSTHHRGELSIVMTRLGHPLPTLDIILQFVAESGQEWPLN